MATLQHLNLNISQLDEEQLNKYYQILPALQASLHKNIDSRNQNDSHVINTFLILSPYFRMLSESISQQFSRNILKNARRIYQQGEKVSRLYLPLWGKCGIYSKNNLISDFNINIYQEMINNIHEQPLFKKKASSVIQRKMSLRLENVELQTAKVNLAEVLIQSEIDNQGTLLINGYYSEDYRQALYTLKDSIFFVITLECFSNCLSIQYDRRIKQKMIFFRSLKCFNLYDDSQLQYLIENTSIVTHKKDDFVFKEGEASIKMFLLFYGQAVVLKNVNLFKQNPNNLYCRQVRSQGSKRNNSISEHAYANFQSVYNYVPQKKIIQIGTISALMLFGDEQILSGSKRQTSVRITSQESKSFQFNLKDLQIIGNIGHNKVNISRFIQQLDNSITNKKINIRQENLTASLTFQNKRNMNYFYLDEQSSPLLNSARSSRKVVTKINTALTTSFRQKQKSQKPPRYNNFNFNDFLQSNQTQPSKNSNFKIAIPRFTDEESKILNLTHMTNDIQNLVQVSQYLSMRKQSFKHKINVMSPLFDISFYKNQRKEVLRIQNKRRMRKLTVSNTKKQIKANFQ